MKAIIWMCVMALGIVTAIFNVSDMYNQWWELKGKYRVDEGFYQHLYIGGWDSNNHDSSFTYKETVVSANLKLMKIPGGEMKAVLSTDFKWNDDKWIETGLFNGKGKFVFGNETYGEGKTDTCYYYLTKDNVLVIDDRNGKLRLSELLKRFERDRAKKRYISVYTFKKEK